MIPLGEMNTLMVFEEILDKPKSAEDLYVTLLLGQGKRPQVPLRLPNDLDEFLATHARRGTLIRDESAGQTKYRVNPVVVTAVRKQIEEVFTPEVDEFLAGLGDVNTPRSLPNNQAA